MPRIIKVRCNGPNKHVNEVDLNKALKENVVLRGVQPPTTQSTPERIVLPCQQCTEGKVILSRKMIEENL